MTENAAMFHFVATARFDETEKQWYPGVIIYFNDNFFNHQEFIIGFDEKRFAMPYARMFRDKIVKIYENLGAII